MQAAQETTSADHLLGYLQGHRRVNGRALRDAD